MFADDVRLEVLDLIAQGHSLRAIGAMKGMPSKATVMRWLNEDEGFQDQYARAKDEQADVFFEDVLSIADLATPEDVAVARLRIDARKWMAGKLRPKKYGDKLDLTHGNPDGTPITFQNIIEAKPGG